MYSAEIIEYHTKQLEILYSEILDNAEYKVYLGYEDFDDEYDSDSSDKSSSKAKKILHNVAAIVKSMFVTLSYNLAKMAKLYNTLSNKYNKILSNPSHINETKFKNTRVTVIPHDKMIKMIKLCNALFELLKDPISSTNSNNSSDFKEVKQALLEIGLDINKLNFKDALSKSYKNNKVKQSIHMHKYEVEDLKDLLQDISIYKDITSSMFVSSIRKKVIAQSTKLTEEFNTADEEDKEKIQTKVTKLWMLANFIKPAYTIANDVCKDLLTLCDVARKCVEE